MTRIYVLVTPLIRYTGMNDIITLDEKTCDCGLQTEIIKRINGRIKESIVLPNEKIVYPDEIIGIPQKVMNKFNTDIINRLQVIQNSLSKIEVLMVLEKDDKYSDFRIDALINELKFCYEKVFGTEVELKIRIINELKTIDKNIPITPEIISKVDVEKFL